jgi:hypothetical protein
MIVVDIDLYNHGLNFVVQQMINQDNREVGVAVCNTKFFQKEAWHFA